MSAALGITEQTSTVTVEKSAVLNWFEQYIDIESGDAATRAGLRRCRSTLDALQIPAAIELARRLGALKTGAAQHRSDRYLEATLDLARVLAHVKRDNGEQPLMRAAGWKKFHADANESDAGEDRPILSGIRFRRMIAGYENEDLVSSFVRLVRLLGNEVNVKALAKDFLDCRDDTKRLQLKKRWTMDYFAANVSQFTEAPQSPDNSETNQ